MPTGCRNPHIIWLLICLLSWRCHIIFGSKVHHHMSIDELRKIFQVEHPNDVPNYEIVQIHSVRHKRSASSPQEDIHRVNLETHGRQLRLELRPNLHLVPQTRHLDLWYADAFPTNVSYSPVEKDVEYVGDVYQDEGNQAALLLYRDKTDDALLMDGTIGDDLVVKPISAKVRSHIQEDSAQYKSQPFAEEFLYEDFDFALEKRRTTDTDDYAFLDENENIEDEDVFPKSRQKRSKNDDDELDPIRSDFHVVYRRKDNMDHISDYHFMEMDRFPTKKSLPDEEDVDDNLIIEQNKNQRKKRQAPYLIFPEILCIIDYDGYRLHGKDNVAIKRYVISFWNGIDLRYKLLKDPGVKISIAGIIISRGRDATPYLERNRVGRDAIDSASALTDMGKYLFLERRLPVYDIAVAITKLDMCRRQSRYGECNRGTAGFAYVGGACVVNKRLEKVNSVAIVEDTGGFSGIIVAAHELGHLLGAVHDGSPPPSYLGGPGARKCRWEDGFIMSDLRHTSKGFRWSHCTIKQFHHFLNGETATCMYNSPHETESLARVLPGKLLTLDAQCRKDRGTSACFKDDRVCAQLFCFDAGSGYCVSYRPAAEGSRCGDGAICLNGKCVVEHENSVDYEGHGFLRRSGLADVGTVDLGKDTPAEPSNDRKWWNLVPTTTEKPSWRERLNLLKKSTTTSTTTSTTSKTTLKTTKSSSTSTTSSSTSTTTTTPSTTSTYYRSLDLKSTESPRFLDLVRSTTKSTTTSTPITTTARLPWWKRLQTKSRLGSFYSRSSRSTTSTTTSTTTTTTTTTTSTTTTTTSTTTTTTTSSPTTPLTTPPSPARRRSQIQSVTQSVSKSSGTATVSEKEGRGKTVTEEDEDDGDDTNEVCEDRINNIAGSLSCKNFLRSFAYQYCRHKYIKKNCCASHKVYCLRGRRGRRARQKLLQQVPSSEVATRSRRY